MLELVNLKINNENIKIPINLLEQKNQIDQNIDEIINDNNDVEKMDDELNGNEGMGDELNGK